VGFVGTVRYDSSKPDGTPRKLLDTKRLKENGWSPKIPLKGGIETTYQWFLQNQSQYRA
jgi:GDP-L-fucose synthase